ncbi:hypothetical protein RHSIM_RhsimUnG0071700 [Rhododendron simsii]|uniref:Transmembrane protein n=1 Tax=Rhododendron simsii TaxID=118357 RepID=A0A834G253_RHOSS|nr:hypothetical protein RHSIM_RhsimUnG0071700 [Rhododendron simsii]
METPNEHLEIEATSPPTTQNVPRETIPNTRDELMSWKELLECETMVQNLSGRISSLRKSAFILVNYYFISQAVVFTALSTNTSLVCRDVWFPLFLSLLPGALNLFALFKIGQEYIETKISQKKCKELWRKGDVYMLTQTNVIRVFNDHNKKIVDMIEEKRLTRNLCCCMCAFGLLAAVVAVGSMWMLCEKSIIFIFKSIIFKLKHNAK